MTIDGRTRLYGIIGNPVAHSLSPAMHNAAFAALGENRVYLPFQTDNLQEAVAGLSGLGIEGVSVTIPFKEDVMKFLDEIDPVAEKIGAVNTVLVRNENGRKRLYGYNTDWLGGNLAVAEQIELQGSSAVILGAGGAARAIGFGLLEAGCTIELRSRTESRGRELAGQLGCQWTSLADRPTAGADILINSTSVGMEPDVWKSPIDADLLSGFKVVMDIVYAPLQTKLLSDAGDAGCSCITGLEMLLYQGVAQFELWTGLDAPVRVMREALRRGVAGRHEKSA